MSTNFGTMLDLGLKLRPKKGCELFTRRPLFENAVEGR